MKALIKAGKSLSARVIHNRRGATAVEYALVVGVIVILIVGLLAVAVEGGLPAVFERMVAKISELMG